MMTMKRCQVKGQPRVFVTHAAFNPGRACYDRGMEHVYQDKTGASVQIRRAHENDAEALIGFIRQVDSESTFLSREPGEFSVPVPQQRLLIKQINQRANSLYLVALHEGTVVATLDYHGGARARTAHSGEFGMSVRRDHWGRGLGGHLLDTLITWAKVNGVTRKIKLRVHAENERAIALYQSRGFQSEGVLRKELLVRGQWIDVQLMAIWLQDEP
jgi:RimJ/RimL family protein N-acetyltransferase